MDNSGIKRSRGRPKTRSDDDRRRAIVDEAHRTFMELGYRGTTTDIVAARCQMSKQTLYKLFSSKVDLFVAVVGAHRKMMLNLPRPENEDLPPAEVLEDIFMIDIGEEAEREREAFIIFVIQESAQVPELGDMLRREGVEQSRAELAEWLSSQAKAGRLEIDDALSGARMLMDLLFGGMGPASRDWSDRSARRRHLQRCIEIFVKGCRPS